MTIRVQLSKLETLSSVGIWGCGVATSLYYLYRVGERLSEEEFTEYDDFSKGWSWIGRFQDISDYEWKTWKELNVQLVPWLLLHIIVAECIRYKRKNNFLPVWYFVITILTLHFNYGFYITLFFITQVLLFFICMYTKKILLLWILAYCTRVYFNPEKWYDGKHSDQYLVFLSSTWMILRSLSYTVDNIMSKENSKNVVEELIFYFGYCFYLPYMATGPFILNEQFQDGVNAKFKPWTVSRCLNIFYNFARCIFWLYFTEFALHYIYVNAILLRPYLVEEFSPWELAGLGIAMGHFFHLKYIVFYGLPSAWSDAEAFQTPPKPCCVSRVYLYSYMWRHFDNGLYQFLKKYIYLPVQVKLPYKGLMCSATASLACFCFVLVWHGGSTYVQFWVVFNYIAVTLEGAAKHLCSKPYIRSFLDDQLSPQNQRRLHCLLAAPLHYFSMVSNYFFIGSGMTVGIIYLNHFLHGSMFSTAVIMFFLYGAAQSSLAIEMLDDARRCAARKK